jgi:FAD/FMN-containing dehydrogenase
MKIKLTPTQIRKKHHINWLLSEDFTDTLIPFPNIKKETIISLEEHIQGRIVFPWTTGYDKAKKEFNDVYPADPFVIVFVVCIQDIKETLEFAQKYNLETRVRSGRHSMTDYSVCDGVVIDISELKSVYIDPVSQTAEIEAGNTFGDINPRLEDYGMHLPGGGCPTVSVAGYMQGGGYSLTSRIFGINSDCVLEVKLVLADGSLIVANENQNRDLFWAVRGGTGGNFGVLISIKYRIFPLGLIWGTQITWDFQTNTDNAAQALYTVQEQYLKGYQHVNMGIETFVYTDIANDGHKKYMFGAAFVGSEEEFDAALAPLMALPGATMLFKKQGKYSEINNKVMEGLPAIPEPQLPFIKYYGRSGYIENSLSVNDYKNILNFFFTVPNTFGILAMEGYGGVINTFPVENSAFIHRNVIMNFFSFVFFDKQTNDQEENREWINSLFEFMEPYCNGHSYQNYPNRDQLDYAWAYWGSYYNQLVAIKQKYDPNNFFNYQQSIGQALSAEKEKLQKIIF